MVVCVITAPNIIIMVVNGQQSLEMQWNPIELQTLASMMTDQGSNAWWISRSPRNSPLLIGQVSYYQPCHSRSMRMASLL